MLWQTALQRLVPESQINVWWNSLCSRVVISWVHPFWTSINQDSALAIKDAIENKTRDANRLKEDTATIGGGPQRDDDPHYGSGEEDGMVRDPEGSDEDDDVDYFDVLREERRRQDNDASTDPSPSPAKKFDDEMFSIVLQGRARRQEQIQREERKSRLLRMYTAITSKKATPTAAIRGPLNNGDFLQELRVNNDSKDNRRSDFHDDDLDHDFMASFVHAKNGRDIVITYLAEQQLRKELREQQQAKDESEGSFRFVKESESDSVVCGNPKECGESVVVAPSPVRSDGQLIVPPPSTCSITSPSDSTMRPRRLEEAYDVIWSLKQKIVKKEAQLVRLEEKERARQEERRERMHQLTFEFLPYYYDKAICNLPTVAVEDGSRVGSYELTGVLLGRGGFGRVVEVRVMADQVDDKETKSGSSKKEKMSLSNGVSVVSRVENHVQPGTRLALKCMKKNHFSDMSNLNNLARELEILTGLMASPAAASDDSSSSSSSPHAHPNIMGCLGMFQGRKHVYILMELAAIDLFDYRSNVYPAMEDEADMMVPAFPIIAKALLRGLEFLHNTKDIAHMDIKMENILVRRTVLPSQLTIDDIQLCDFGLAIAAIKTPSTTAVDTSVPPSPFMKTSGNNNKKKKAKTTADDDFIVYGVRGTYGLMPPEMLLANECSGKKADIWSTGVTLIECFRGGALPAAWPQIGSSYYSETEGVDDNDGTCYCDRIMNALEVVWAEGFNQATGLEEFLRLEFCMGMLEWVPARRPSASEALGHEWLLLDLDGDDNENKEEQQAGADKKKKKNNNNNPKDDVALSSQGQKKQVKHAPPV